MSQNMHIIIIINSHQQTITSHAHHHNHHHHCLSQTECHICTSSLPLANIVTHIIFTDSHQQTVITHAHHHHHHCLSQRECQTHAHHHCLSPTLSKHIYTSSLSLLLTNNYATKCHRTVKAQWSRGIC